MEFAEEPSCAVVRNAMFSALLSVIDWLPPNEQNAVRLAASSEDLQRNQEIRVALWQSIRGRDMLQTPEVLFTRLAICTVHPGMPEHQARDTREYFVSIFRKAGLPEHALAATLALETYYRA